jgi:hypothetical protein
MPLMYAWVPLPLGRSNASARYEALFCGDAVKSAFAIQLTDTRRVSGLPRQFGIFRPIVGPGGAYFTRRCEVCGLISSHARPSAFGGRASRRAALGGQPGPLPQRAGRRADSAAPGIGAEGAVPVASRPVSQPTMPTTWCSARREDAIAPLAGRAP